MSEVLSVSFLESVGGIVLNMSAFFFCLVVGLFIIPLVIERLAYHIPRLIFLVRDGDAYKKSLPIVFFSAIGWISVVVVIYVFLYYVFPVGFELVTVSSVAMAAWIIAGANLIYRFLRFNKTVKRWFYHTTYMHYITPEALQAYQVFIESIDEMTNTQMRELAGRIKELPYMHRQALHRKMGERGLLDSALSK